MNCLYYRKDASTVHKLPTYVYFLIGRQMFSIEEAAKKWKSGSWSASITLFVQKCLNMHNELVQGMRD